MPSHFLLGGRQDRFLPRRLPSWPPPPSMMQTLVGSFAEMRPASTSRTRFRHEQATASSEQESSLSPQISHWYWMPGPLGLLMAGSKRRLRNVVMVWLDFS